MHSPASPSASPDERGTVGELLRVHDWRHSPLGPPQTWAAELRTVLDLMLGSKFPMFVAYGPQLGFLYNDAYAQVLGEKHPAAIGRRFEDIWSEIWHEILPIVEDAMQGRSTFHKDLPLTMNRKGFEEQTWFTFSYSPVRNEAGLVTGMFCACTETTDQVLAERQLAEQHQRMRQMFQQAPGIIAVLREPAHVFEFANDSYLQADRRPGRAGPAGQGGASRNRRPAIPGPARPCLPLRRDLRRSCRIGHAAPAAGPAPRGTLRRLRLPADPRRARRGLRHLRRRQRRDGCSARYAGAAGKRAAAAAACQHHSATCMDRGSRRPCPLAQRPVVRVHRNAAGRAGDGARLAGLFPSGRHSDDVREDGGRRSPVASPTRPPAGYGARTAPSGPSM